MPSNDNEYRIRAVGTAILTIRVQKVILDAGLARLYGVTTALVTKYCGTPVHRLLPATRLPTLCGSLAREGIC